MSAFMFKCIHGLVDTIFKGTDLEVFFERDLQVVGHVVHLAMDVASFRFALAADLLQLE